MTYLLNEKLIRDMAAGSAFLGSGGGGDTRIVEIITNQALQNGAVLSITALNAVEDTATVAAVGAMGAPTVLAEKLPSQHEGIIAIQKLEEVLNKKLDYVIGHEIGGLNGLYAIYMAAQANKKIIDGDCMGRAFPEIHMVTPNISGNISNCIAVLSNAQSCSVIEAKDLRDLEEQARQRTVKMGGVATVAFLPMTGKEARQTCIANSISVACKLGQHLRNYSGQAFAESLNIALHETGYSPAQAIMTGKISELQRDFSSGFNRGWMIVQALDTGRRLKIEFQNENLRMTDLATSTIIALVPTIITLLDNENRPLSCECLRVGLDVNVFTLEVPPMLRTPAALKIFGPVALGLQ